MVRNDNERQMSVKENMRDGDGSISFKEIATKQELYDKARMFSEVIIKKDCSIGYHTHTDEEEVILIKKGKVIYNDNGVEKQIGEGDVAICEAGHGHSLANPYDEDAVLVALVMLK